MRDGCFQKIWLNIFLARYISPDKNRITSVYVGVSQHPQTSSYCQWTMEYILGGFARHIFYIASLHTLYWYSNLFKELCWWQQIKKIPHWSWHCNINFTKNKTFQSKSISKVWALLFHYTLTFVCFTLWSVDSYTIWHFDSDIF